MPVLIGEEAYRNHPELVKHIYLCNTFDKKDDKPSHDFIGYTTAVKDGIMSVETRHITPLFLAEYTDLLFIFPMGISFKLYYGGLVWQLSNST